MQDIFLRHIETEYPEMLKTPFLIAISGGVDSVVLAHLCYQCNLDFALAHCNFKLRGTDSDKDALFVEELAETLNCKFFKTEFETENISKEKKASIQITARELRYSWFKALIDQSPYKYILTAHHLDDSLETFIINLSRSTGLKGLSGIPHKTNHVLRPLLDFSKQAIRTYAKENKLEWREDKSNASTKYLRNQIRHAIIPELKNLHPQFLENFKTTQRNLRQTEALVEEFTSNLKDELVEVRVEDRVIDIQKLKAYRNIKVVLYQILKDYEFTAWDDVYHLMDAQTGKYVESNNHKLVKDRNKLILSPLTEPKFSSIKINKNQSELRTANFKLAFKTQRQLGGFSSQIAYLDKERLDFPLVLRQIKPGDYFYPMGMTGKKKLSDFLKDEKISPHRKKSQLVLCNGNGDILWVLGMRIDDRYKIKEETGELLKIEILK